LVGRSTVLRLGLYCVRLGYRRRFGPRPQVFALFARRARRGNK